jgi:hypothetical protein
MTKTEQIKTLEAQLEEVKSYNVRLLETLKVIEKQNGDISKHNLKLNQELKIQKAICSAFIAASVSAQEGL